MRRLIIIPTYNERENVTRMIRRLMAMEPEFDLLVVDDGSPDGTAGLVREEQATIRSGAGGAASDVGADQGDPAAGTPPVCGVCGYATSRASGSSHVRTHHVPPRDGAVRRVP